MFIDGEKFARSEGQVSLENLELLIYFWCEWILRNCLVPGHVESWLVVLDLTNVGITLVPLDRI